MASLIDRYVNDLVNYAVEQKQMERYYTYALILIRGTISDGMDQLPDELSSFLNLLSPADAEAVLYKFIDIAREHLELLDVKIFSAVPLTMIQRVAIENKLVDIFGKKICVVAKVEPSLLGGLRIVVGHVVLDNTIKKRLAEMKKNVYKGVRLK